MKIGTLKKVEIREIWPHEKGFSEWLSDNIDILGEAIGLDLEEPETEFLLDNSGSRADIVAKTKEEEEKVIIENQLEKTDHKHLGQTMTYMINVEAKVAVWIAKEVKEEHIKVFSSFNNESKDKDFYLIQLESYLMDNLKPALFFKVICQPSEEDKKEKKEASKIKKAFWTKLREKTDYSLRITGSTTIKHNIDNKGSSLLFRVNKYETEIGFRFSPHLKTYFDNLKKEWEEKLGLDLKFKKTGNAGQPSDKYEFVTCFEKGGWKTQEKWNEIQEEMIDNMSKLERLVNSALDELESSNKVA